MLQGTWNAANYIVIHPQATPLKCVCNDDIPSFKLKINSLPAGYVIWAVPQGSSFTSTATISANTVRFTLPANVNDIECWEVNIDDPNTSQQGPYKIWVKLHRQSAPPP